LDIYFLVVQENYQNFVDDFSYNMGSIFVDSFITVFAAIE